MSTTRNQEAVIQQLYYDLGEERNGEIHNFGECFWNLAEAQKRLAVVRGRYPRAFITRVTWTRVSGGENGQTRLRAV